MTGTAAAEALARPPFPLDTAAWGRWLRDRLDPGWRPGEWDAATWLFTGDPDNPATSVTRCRTVACRALLHGRTVRFCEACQRDLAGSEVSEQDFVATHVPVGRHCSPGGTREACLVSREGATCARPRFARSMCLSHYMSWQAYRRRSEVTGQELEPAAWSRRFATPYPDPPSCLVAACPGSASGSRGLCGYHVRLWWNAGKVGEAGTPTQWAAGQIRYLAGYQFSLMPLPELLRWEVLFALQHRDEPRRSLNPSQVRSAVTELGRMRLTTLVADPPALDTSRPVGHKGVAGELKYLFWAARVVFDEFSGVKPTDKTVLDLRAVRLAPKHRQSRRRRVPGAADLAVIEQLWLRRLMQRWVEIEHPPARTFNQTLRAVRMASRALAERPGGGHDSTSLRFTDMSAVVAVIWSQTNSEGTPYAVNTAGN